MANKKLQPIIIWDVRRQSSLSDVKEFLDENYEIRINLFNPSRPFIKPLKRKYKYGVDFRDIYLDLVENNISCSLSTLKMLLTSPNRMKTFNPIEDYFDTVRGKYKGESHIDLLADHLRARDFGDREPGYYQERLRRYLKKWLVAAVACAFGIRYNDVSVGFISEEGGIGKTYITQFLIPYEIRDYRVDAQPPSEKFELEREFTRNLFVNFDEFVGITRSTTERFKKLLSASDICLTSNGFSSNVTRRASATFTTNRTEELGGFLTQNMGTRRFLCFELDSIDQRYSERVDINQVYAEALLLMEKADFCYVWGMDDFKEFEQYNSRYMQKSAAYNVLRDLYTPAISEKEPHAWLMPSEILRRLKHDRKISISDGITEESIGMALRQLGFQRAKKKINGESRWRYLVKREDQEKQIT